MKYIIIVLMLTLYGCSAGSSSTSNTYFPISAGSRWSYKAADFMEVRVISEKQESSGIRYTFNDIPFFQKDDSGKDIIVNKDGEVIFDSQITENIKMLPSPSQIKKGFSWQTGSWSASIGNDNETVIAGGKTYKNCIAVNYSLSFTFLTEIWYCPNVGIVKWGANRTNPPTQMIYYELQ